MRKKNGEWATKCDPNGPNWYNTFKSTKMVMLVFGYLLPPDARIFIFITIASQSSKSTCMLATKRKKKKKRTRPNQTKRTIE